MKKRYRIVTSIACVLMLLIALIPCAHAVYYADVAKGSLNREEFDSIMYVSDNGYMVGTGNNAFQPNASVTRAAFVQLLYNHRSKHGSVGSASVNLPFTDVPETAWFYDAVCWAYTQGLVSGTSDTQFSPNDSVIMEQAITILKRYADAYYGSFSYSTSLIYTHSDYNNISNYARDAVNWALEYRLIKPTSLNAALNPKSVLPRKTIAVYICQFDKEIEGLDKQAKRFSFTNSRTYYYSTETAGNPYISDYHKNLVVDFFYDYYGSNTTTGINKVGAVLSNLNNKWAGSCHGMSIAFLFDAMGKVDFNRYIGTSSMRTIPYPKNSNLVASSLNFYQVACNYHVDFCNKYQKSSGNMATGLSAMASDFDKYGAILLSYFWPGQDDEGNSTTNGHTVVVLDMESNGNMSYSVSYYDSRYQSIQSSTASINNGYLAFESLSNITTIQYYTQLEYNAMDGLDLDGAYNNMNHGDTMNTMELPDELSTAQFADSHAGKTYIIAPATDFTIVNANGETLHFSEGVLSGNMDYDDLYFIPYGDGSPAEVSFVVDDSESFNLDLFNDNTENIRIYVSCEEYSTSVIGSGFTNLHFQTDDIAVMGSDIEITAIVRSNSGNDEYTRFYGTGDNLINIEQTDSQIIASGFYGDYSVQLYDRTLVPSNMIYGVIDAQEIIIDYEEDPIIPPADQMYSDEADAVVYYVSDFYS